MSKVSQGRPEKTSRISRAYGSRRARYLLIVGAAMLLGGFVPRAADALTVDKAELKGGELKLEGGDAVNGATIRVDGIAQGNADDRGQFKIQFSPFDSATCSVVVSDGQGQVIAPVSGCAPTTEPPPPDPGPRAFTLTVTASGPGSGRVTSLPAGIVCGLDCTQDYVADTVVTLTATADAGSTFMDFGGDADCLDGSVTMNTSKGCTATFDAAPTTDPPPGKPTFFLRQEPGQVGQDLIYQAQSFTLGGSLAFVFAWGDTTSLRVPATGFLSANASGTVISPQTFHAWSLPGTYRMTITAENASGSSSVSDPLAVTILPLPDQNDAGSGGDVGNDLASAHPLTVVPGEITAISGTLDAANLDPADFYSLAMPEDFELITLSVIPEEGTSVAVKFFDPDGVEASATKFGNFWGFDFREHSFGYSTNHLGATPENRLWRISVGRFSGGPTNYVLRVTHGGGGADCGAYALGDPEDPQPDDAPNNGFSTRLGKEVREDCTGVLPNEDLDILDNYSLDTNFGAVAIAVIPEGRVEDYGLGVQSGAIDQITTTQGQTLQHYSEASGAATRFSVFNGLGDDFDGGYRILAASTKNKDGDCWLGVGGDVSDDPLNPHPMTTMACVAALPNNTVDEDWYSFEVEAGQLVFVTFKPDNGASGCCPSVAVFNAEGNPVAHHQSVVGTAGTWKIRVHRNVAALPPVQPFGAEDYIIVAHKGRIPIEPSGGGVTTRVYPRGNPAPDLVNPGDLFTVFSRAYRAAYPDDGLNPGINVDMTVSVDNSLIADLTPSQIPTQTRTGLARGGNRLSQWIFQAHQAGTVNVTVTTTTPDGTVNSPDTFALEIGAFQPRETLTVAAEGKGWVESIPAGLFCAGTPDSVPVTCTATALHGIEFRLLTRAAPGWVFTGWRDDPLSSDPDCLDGNVTMDVATACAARFMPETPPPSYQLRVETLGIGAVTGTGIACGGALSDCTEDYPAGAAVALTASGGAAIAWNEGCAGGQVTMTGRKLCRTIFEGGRAPVAPVAKAGPDQSLVDADLDGSELVTLDGSASFDPDAGGIVSYAWHEGGLNVPPFATGPNPVLVVPLAVGGHVLNLVVTDSDGLTDFDTIIITIEAFNARPVACIVAPTPGQTFQAGPDGTAQVVLDGSCSTDSDGVVTEWFWSDNGASLTQLVNPTVSLSAGTHDITLNVLDEKRDQSVTPATVTIVVEPWQGPTPPNLTVNVTAPALANRGDEFTVSAVISDLGGNGAASVSVELTWTPSGNLRARGSALNQTVAIAANGEATVSWTLEARNEGVTALAVTATDGVTGTVFSGAGNIEVIK